MSAPATVVRSSAELLALIPYQLGFHPSRSLVVVTIRQGRLALTQRLDLVDTASADGSLSDLVDEPNDCVASVDLTAQVIARERPCSVVLVAYDETGAGAWLRSRIRRQCVGVGVEVADELLVRHGHWIRVNDVVAGDVAVVPGGANQVPTSLGWQPLPRAADVPALAEWVGIGVAPLPDRESLVATLLPDRGVAARVHAAVNPGWDSTGTAPDGFVSRDRALVGWEKVLDPRAVHPQVGNLPPAQLLDAVSGVRATPLRDALIDWLGPGSLRDSAIPGERRYVRRWLGPTPWSRRPAATTPGWFQYTQVEAMLRCQSRLAELVRCLPAELQPVPLAMLATFAWWRGDGGLSSEAADRALRIDPECTLAGLLLRLIGNGVRI